MTTPAQAGLRGDGAAAEAEYVSMADEWAASDRIAARLQAKRPEAWQAWQAWQATCRLWVEHIDQCDPCWDGKACAAADRLLDDVCAAWAVVEGKSS